MVKSGINIIGEVPWGTHFCQFYQTKQDLIDVLVPYFREGLRQNEFCMWITSEPLGAVEAEAALRQAVPDLDVYLNRGQIEILDYSKWYTATGKFEADRVLQGWIDKEQYAREHGFEGLRLTGNTCWLETQDWKDFSDYEAVVDDVIGKYRMIAVCTYCIDKCGAYEMIDVVSNHQFALIKQSGEWKIIESQKQQKIETALSQLEAFVKHCITPLVFLDKDFNFIRVNEAYAKACQRDVAEFPGHNHFEFYPSIENEGIFREVVRSKHSYQAVAKPFIFPDHPEWGVTYWDWTLTPILDQTGEVEFLVFTLEDVTKRVNAEKSLVDSEKRYRSFTLATTEIIWTTNAAGEVVDDMPSWRDFTGQTEQEIKGWGWSNALHPDDIERTKAVWAEAVRERKFYETEYRLRRHDGQYRYMSARGVPVLENEGEISEWVGTCVDITERKRMDEELRSLHEALERRAAQLQHLASELTLTEQRERRRLAQLLHDHLQQLLYAARLSVTSLKRRVQEKEVQDMVQHLDILLGQCIDESRSVTVELSPPVLYDAGLASALEWLARQMQLNYGLAIEVETDLKAEPETEDIKVLLFQSVRELLFNIVKHAGAQSAVVKMTSTPDRQVRIDVVDKGSGFNSAKLESNGKHKPGFGLFSIRERLEQMGGRLEIHTVLGQGTHISIFAPCQWRQISVDGGPAKQPLMAKTLASPAAKATVTGAARRIRVILADDHTILRKGLVGVLNQEPDIEVVAEAADGEMAIELTRQFCPDVVLMDVTMPKVDGIEATRRITMTQRGVGIIGFSAHKEEDMAQALYKAGAIAYLSKDEPTEFLIAAIRNVSSRSAN